MPNYPGAGGATVPVVSNTSGFNLEKGESQYVFGVLKAGATQLPVNDTNAAGEQPAVPQASMSCNLQAGSEGQPNPVLGVEILFSGAPGVFQIEIQVADTDADGLYVTPGDPAYTITSVNANNAAQVALSPGKKYVRARLTSRANAVNLLLKFTRIA